MPPTSAPPQSWSPKNSTAHYFKGYDILYLEGYLIFNLPLVEQACRLAKENKMCIALDLSSFNVVTDMLPSI
ncbi:MAG: hypothetical protein MZV63_51055 [Marinilabiliales bacterium]|nr:hypothetical protein [Marinilabiliales bacterium]